MKNHWETKTFSTAFGTPRNGISPYPHLLRTFLSTLLIQAANWLSVNKKADQIAWLRPPFWPRNPPFFVWSRLEITF